MPHLAQRDRAVGSHPRLDSEQGHLSRLHSKEVVMAIATRGVCAALMAFVLTVFAASDARAVVDLANGWGPSALETSKLPDYCQRFFLERKLPPNCDGVHHLCAGKVLMLRLTDFSIPKQERQRILGHAKSEVEYMFGRQNASCTYLGQAREAQRQLRTFEALLR
ncbi:MAG: hypothetical protein IT502_08650 [Rubrivivax sp.]|nr:hypothetical protein [Rubrivivax sp.]